MTPNRRNRGFTLIELLIVVAIIGILAAVAYPSYKNYVLKGHRASAQAFLMDAAQREQQYFLDNRAYTDDLNTLFGISSPVPTEVSPYYTITLDPPGAAPPTFLIKATPKGTQVGNNEPELTIDHAGTKLPSTSW